MNHPLQTIRLSKREVDILNALKRKSKINQWNILCRMAFCLSCAIPKEPEITSTPVLIEGGTEIDWATFGGDNAEIFSALTRAHKKKVNSDATDSEYFKKLLYRGIILLKDQHC